MTSVSSLPQHGFGASDDLDPYVLRTARLRAAQVGKLVRGASAEGPRAMSNGQRDSCGLVADLHAHYHMHIVPKTRGGLWRLLFSARGRARLRDIIRAWLLGLASRFGNYRSPFSGSRLRVGLLRDGDVRIVLSVLYQFFDEVAVGEPRRSYSGPCSSRSPTSSKSTARAP